MKQKMCTLAENTEGFDSSNLTFSARISLCTVLSHASIANFSKLDPHVFF